MFYIISPGGKKRMISTAITFASVLAQKKVYCEFQNGSPKQATVVEKTFINYAS